MYKRQLSPFVAAEALAVLRALMSSGVILALLTAPVPAGVDVLGLFELEWTVIDCDLPPLDVHKVLGDVATIECDGEDGTKRAVSPPEEDLAVSSRSRRRRRRGKGVGVTVKSCGDSK